MINIVNKTFILVVASLLLCDGNVFSQTVLSEKSKIRVNTMALGQKPSPDIAIVAPEALKQAGTFMPTESVVPLVFRLTNPEAGVKVYINNVEVTSTSEDFIYYRSLTLIRGENMITVTVMKDDRIIKEHSFRMVYFPSVRNNSPVAINTGKYYAVIIGNSSYNDPGLANLRRPVQDARALKDVLVTKYLFDNENVYLPLEKDLESIILIFDELQRKLTEDDNLLIFYAGHGKMDDTGLGYWLFSDAKLNSTFRWFPNSRLTDYMSSYKAKHILLIADACFAGSIYETRGVLDDAPESIQDLYKNKSRKAITSGGTSEVSDNSKFAEYLIDQLQSNTNKYLTSSELYHSIQVAVQNNSKNSPRWGAVQNVGDRNGDFIFILRDK
jgi:hypothetical protein